MKIGVIRNTDYTGTYDEYLKKTYGEKNMLWFFSENTKLSTNNLESIEELVRQTDIVILDAAHQENVQFIQHAVKNIPKLLIRNVWELPALELKILHKYQEEAGNLVCVDFSQSIAIKEKINATIKTPKSIIVNVFQDKIVTPTIIKEIFEIASFYIQPGEVKTLTHITPDGHENCKIIDASVLHQEKTLFRSMVVHNTSNVFEVSVYDEKNQLGLSVPRVTEKNLTFKKQLEALAHDKPLSTLNQAIMVNYFMEPINQQAEKLNIKWSTT